MTDKALVITIADAVVAATNAAPAETWPEALEFTAARRYAPVYNVDKLKTLQVSVVPHGDESNISTRAGHADTIAKVDIGVQMYVGGRIDEDETVALLDSLMLLSHDLGQYFFTKTLDMDTSPRCVKTSRMPSYDHEHLNENGVFTSAVTLTFHMIG